AQPRKCGLTRPRSRCRATSFEQTRQIARPPVSRTRGKDAREEPVGRGGLCRYCQDRGLGWLRGRRVVRSPHEQRKEWRYEVREFEVRHQEGRGRESSGRLERQRELERQGDF